MSAVQTPGSNTVTPVVLERDQHSVSRRNISKGALNVIYDLNQAGYEAYLVGGGIRDLLLGQRPKDFDVATNATPEQIRQLFRRSRIVGRRFQIVHVRFGREIIEVTTFRKGHDASPLPTHVEAGGKDAEAVTSQSGMLLRDNVFGSIEDDALRRDFTVNALYYTVDGFRVLDYAGGLEDLEARLLRLIGDPETRYQEDPVRMLRAVRFAAKLDFEIEAQSRDLIPALADRILDVSPARLFDEINKLFLNTAAVRCLELLQQFGLFKHLFPAVDHELAAKPHYQTLLDSALGNTAERVREGKPVTPAFLYAALLWPRVDQLYYAHLNDGHSQQRALQLASYQTIDEQVASITIPKRFSIVVREIWALQLNLLNARNRRATKLLSHPRFRAAYDFLLVREASGEALERGAAFWTELQEEHPDAVQREVRKAPRRRRRGGRSSANRD